MDWETQAYNVRIVDKHNQEVILLAMEVDKISSEEDAVERVVFKVLSQV